MTHRATLEQWHEILAEAIRDGKLDAVPGILGFMALDGWGHEAEIARREMLEAAKGPRSSLGEQTGHDPEAVRQLETLVAVHQRHGIPGIRDAVDGFLQMSTAEQDRAILVEAVLQLAERSARSGRRAAEDFDRAEAADERARERIR